MCQVDVTMIPVQLERVPMNNFVAVSCCNVIDDGLGLFIPVPPSVVVMLLKASGTSIITVESTFFSSHTPFVILNGNSPLDSTSIDLSSDPTPINLSSGPTPINLSKC